MASTIKLSMYLFCLFLLVHKNGNTNNRSSDIIYIICNNSQLQRHPDTIEPVMAAKKWTCTLAMGCYPGGLPFEREERSPILRSTEHPHPQAHIFQGQTQWRFQMRRPEPKLVTKTQLPSSIWASLCHLFDNLTAKGSPYLVTTVSAKLIMHGLSLLFFIFFLPLSAPGNVGNVACGGAVFATLAPSLLSFSLCAQLLASVGHLTKRVDILSVTLHKLDFYDFFSNEMALHNIILGIFRGF